MDSSFTPAANNTLKTSASDRVAGRSRRLVLGAILGLFGLIKAIHNPYPIGYWAVDSSYYYQVAQHVAAGHGLLTNVSLYHQGLSPLPHLAPIYPVWPLVLGAVGSVVGLDTAAVWLPELCYLASLLLLYQLTVAVASRFGDPTIVRWRGRPLLDVGHLLVMLFGSNHVYFRVTSFPFTEGLAFAVGFGMLLACEKCARTDSATWGLLAGVLGALAFLIRSQFLGFAFTPSICLGLVSLGHPSLRRAFVAASASAGLIFLVWVTFLMATFERFVPQMLLDVVAYRQDPHLDPYVWLVDRGSFMANLADRAKGLYTAFHPTRAFSYTRSFDWAVYTIPLAVLVVLAKPRILKAGLAAALRPRALVVTATLVAGIASVTLVHLLHTPYGWFFDYRQGLPLVFMLVVAVGFLACSGSLPLRLVAVALIGISVWRCQERTWSRISRQSTHPPTEAQIQLREWIDQQSPSTLFIATEAQALAAITGGRFHFASCGEKPDQMAVFFNDLKIDYLVTTGGDRQCEFFKAIAGHLQPAMSFSGGEEIVVWRYARAESETPLRPVQDRVDTVQNSNAR